MCFEVLRREVGGSHYLSNSHYVKYSRGNAYTKEEPQILELSYSPRALLVDRQGKNRALMGSAYNFCLCRFMPIFPYLNRFFRDISHDFSIFPSQTFVPSWVFFGFFGLFLPASKHFLWGQVSPNFHEAGTSFALRFLSENECEAVGTGVMLFSQRESSSHWHQRKSDFDDKRS